MSCNDKQHFHDVNCVCDVVNFINEIQDAITNSCPTGCENPFLGANNNRAPLANTRPFALFNSKGGQFVPICCFVVAGEDRKHHGKDGHCDEDFVTVNSPLLRVESVDDCCALVRVLVPDLTFPEFEREERKEIIQRLYELLSSAKSAEERSSLLACLFQNGFDVKLDHHTRPITILLPLTASDCCVTVDLNCFCAVQCFRDTFVSGI
ncbi:MAG: CotY/CotZ family spore coat protein [Ectobacillus sp.]